MDATLIGCEVSLPIVGSRSRTRGYIAEPVDQGLLVRIYPTDGDEFTEVIDPVGLRVLKANVPSGWHAVDVLDDDDTLRFSMRFRVDVIAAIEEVAKERECTLEAAFNYLLRLGLELRRPRARAQRSSS